MNNLTCKELREKHQKFGDIDVQINGHVKTVRDSKNIVFLEVNDGTSNENVQVVLKKSEVIALPNLTANSSLKDLKKLSLLIVELSNLTQDNPPWDLTRLYELLGDLPSLRHNIKKDGDDLVKLRESISRLASFPKSTTPHDLRDTPELKEELFDLEQSGSVSGKLLRDLILELVDITRTTTPSDFKSLYDLVLQLAKFHLAKHHFVKEELAQVKELRAKLPTLSINSAISVMGRVALTAGREQPFEVKASTVEVLNLSSDTYPLQKKEQTLDFLRTKQEYRSSTKYFNTVFRLKSRIVKYTMDFFEKNEFMWTQTPIITTNDAEGAGESFEATPSVEEYFPKNAYLTVSGQLSAEALAQSFHKVYAFGPTFRAEKSDTPSHVSEFWMLEPEVSFSDYNQSIALGLNMLSHVAKMLLKNNVEELSFLAEKNGVDLAQRLSVVAKKSHIKLTYKKALKLLNKEMPNTKLRFGHDLGKEHERFLTTHFKKVVVLTNFPMETSPFYMYDNGDKTSRSFDFLVEEVGEIIGGSQREDRFDVLEPRIKVKQSPELLRWYLELRKHGFAPSAGFGLGMERLVMYLLGVKNIRDVQSFPRSYKQLSF